MLRLADLDARRERFARRIAAVLSAHAERSAPDVDERLRFAREQALQRARATSATAAADAQLVARATAALRGGDGSSLAWLRLASVLPLVALLAGLLLIQRWNTQAQIAAAAEIDAELLSDSLPPQAYRDPGFAEFLKAARE